MNSQQVTILGPNLRDQSRHFVVHAAGCRDIPRVKLLGGRRAMDETPWTIGASTLARIAEEVYGDQIREGSMTLAEAFDDIHFAPCVKLPVSA